MELKGKHKDRLQKTILSCDSFATGGYAFALLFFVIYAARHCNIYAVAFLPLACLLPFALLPVFYTVIHRFSPLLFGRYHLIMPISAFTAAIFYVLMWSSADASSPSDACSLYFGTLFFVLSASLYGYCAFSVRARLSGDNISAPSAYSLCFFTVGAFAAIASAVGFYSYDKATAYINTAYVIGAVCMLFALVHYLTTYYGIPRLGGKRSVTVGGAFRTFYGGINKRTYFSSLLFQAAYLTAAAFAVYIGFSRVSVRISFGAALAFAAVYAVVAFLCASRVKRRSKILSVLILLCLLFSATALILTVALKLSYTYSAATVVCAAALAGAGGALTMRQMRLRFITVKSRITSGIVYVLLLLTALAAAALVLTVTVVAFSIENHTGSVFSLICGPAATAAFTIAAFVLARKKLLKNERLPELSYELSADEDFSSRSNNAKYADDGGLKPDNISELDK